MNWSIGVKEHMSKQLASNLASKDMMQAMQAYEQASYTSHNNRLRASHNNMNRSQ